MFRRNWENIFEHFLYSFLNIYLEQPGIIETPDNLLLFERISIKDCQFNDNYVQSGKT